TVILNAPFTVDHPTASSTFSGTMYWGAASTSHTFYAYYPYAGSAGSPAATIVPVSLATAQTQSIKNNSDHIGAQTGALDFMVATPVTVTSPANTNAVGSDVNLSYNHLFTILEFQIKGTGTTLSAVKLSGSNTLAFSSGTIDITQAPVTDVAYTIASKTGTATQAVVTLTTPATLDATIATTVYMVINPGTQTGNCLIGLSDGTNWTYISKAAPNGGFLRGKKYVVSVDAATATDPVIDVDGNIYTTVTIGTQVWMAENLKTTKYNDNSAILNVTDNTTWAGRTEGAYCWYSNDETTYKPTYGALYNGYAVNTTKLCPTGWHVPTNTEWTTLTTDLGGLDVAGGKLKETGTTHWLSPNTGATNTSGFTALPGGSRDYSSGTFDYIGRYGNWWSSTMNKSQQIYYRTMYNNASDVDGSPISKTYGFSVRCLKN
ncbi:MAG TPA: FISUMP domain-containing protein, partial [Prolixibacteraceae bacterium]